MASKIITKGLKRTALSVALGMCFAGSVYAQSNSAGAITGTTDCRRNGRRRESGHRFPSRSSRLAQTAATASSTFRPAPTR